MAARGGKSRRHLNRHTRKPQVGPEEIIAKVQRPELKMARAHPLRPGTVDADRQLCRRVSLMGNLDGPRGDPDLLFLGQTQDLTTCRPVHHVPERNSTPIALNCLPHEVGHEPRDRLAVPFPKPDPVGSAPWRNSTNGPTSDARPTLRDHAS